MANPVCLSPLKFYDSADKQSHKKSYAYSHISPLLVKFNSIPPFQFVLPKNASLSSAYLRNIKGQSVAGNIASLLIEAGLATPRIEGYRVVIFPGIYPIVKAIYEGEYYLQLNFSGGLIYYSEIFCFTNSNQDYLEIEYWNRASNFAIKNGIIAFPTGFHFKLLLNTELGKPEYTFEEESTKRLGYNFIETQVSKKIYKFNTILPEFICDAMRIIRLCDNKIIRSKGDNYEAITFEMDVDWQTQGDLASVTCEFETDNIIANLGGFVPEDAGGAFNENDFNKDYDIS